MNPWQAVFFGLKQIPRELTAFELRRSSEPVGIYSPEGDYAKAGAELGAIPGHQR
jgi:hypothetical protein